MVQAGQLARYASALQAIVEGNPTAQVEVMAAARAEYEGARRGPAALRFGLLLAAPGHPQRNATEAQRVLREALAQSELLSHAEQALGQVELARLEAELRLTTEIGRLTADLQERERSRAAAAADTTLNRRLQAEMETSARLRKELDEAKAKLDAITRMERNSADRPPAPEGR